MTKLTLKDAKNNLPAAVADFVRELADQHHTRKISFELRQSVYGSEDATFTGFAGGQATGQIETGGEWGGVQAGALLINHALPLPVGAYLVEGRFFLGKYFITVYHNNGQPQIAR